MLWGSCLPIFCFLFPHQMGSHTLQFLMQATTQPAQPELEGGPNGLNPSVFYQKPEPSSQPGDQRKRMQLNFLLRSLYQGLARPSGSVRPQALSEWHRTTYKMCRDTCRMSNSFSCVLSRKGTYCYGAYTESQDFTYTVLLNPHKNVVKVVVLFLLMGIQTSRKQVQGDWMMSLKPHSQYTEIYSLTVTRLAHLGVSLPSTPHINASPGLFLPLTHCVTLPDINVENEYKFKKKAA